TLAAHPALDHVFDDPTQRPPRIGPHLLADFLKFLDRRVGIGKRLAAMRIDHIGGQQVDFAVGYHRGSPVGLEAIAKRIATHGPAETGPDFLAFQEVSERTPPAPRQPLPRRLRNREESAAYHGSAWVRRSISKLQAAGFWPWR